MRPFPRTARSRMAAASAAAALALGTVVVQPIGPAASLASGDNLKDKQKRVEKQVQRASKDLEESSARLQRAADRLESARTQLTSARTALATAQGRLAVAEEQDARMQAELAQAEADLAQAQADLEAGEAETAAQRDVVAGTIVSTYTEGDPDLIAFSSLLESSSANDLSRRAELNQAVVDRQERAYDRLRAAEVLLTVKEAEVERARDDVAEKRQAAADNLVVKQQAEAEAADAEAVVAGLVGERKAARAEAVQARQVDQRQLAKAERESRRIEAELKRRAEEALRRARARAARNAQAGGPTGGILSAPVPGAVTSPFGYRTHPIYGYWGLHDGTDFGVSCGEPIRASADGTVMSRYYSSVYGNRLILDQGALNGAGVATIYNHASSYVVAQGERVQRGQVIGYVGDTGWSTGCHLHYTVMVNGKAVDPMGWL